MTRRERSEQGYVNKERTMVAGRRWMSAAACLVHRRLADILKQPGLWIVLGVITLIIAVALFLFPFVGIWRCRR